MHHAAQSMLNPASFRAHSDRLRAILCLAKVPLPRHGFEIDCRFFRMCFFGLLRYPIDWRRILLSRSHLCLDRVALAHVIPTSSTPQ